MREIPRGHGRLGVAEHEQAAFERIGARLQRDVRDGAAGAAKLRVVVAGADADGFDRLGRRHEHGEQARLVIVVNALELHVVGEPRLPVHVGRQAVLRVEELRVGAERPRRAGHRDQHALEVAIESERHRLDQHAFDDASRVGTIRLQQRRLGRDRNRFLDHADFQLQIDAHRGVDVDFDALAHRLLEPAQFGFNPVDAVPEREGVETGLVGHGRGARYWCLLRWRSPRRPAGPGLPGR